MNQYKHKSSFRDPSGFLFWEENNLYRQINLNYRENYIHLIDSGLYNELTNNNLLISHREVSNPKSLSCNAFKVIQPLVINFISYPYEWSFSQLKDAALTTLKIQKHCLDYGMTLKDASAYNIQFYKGSPVLIDTLSFETYKEGSPWFAYKQFCQHFLAPLALLSFTDLRLNQLLRDNIDGIPLDLTSKLLPVKTRFISALLMHIHWHAKAQIKYEEKDIKPQKIKIKKNNLYALINSLESTIKMLKLKVQVTEWNDYYTKTNYSEAAFAHKKKIVEEYLGQIHVSQLWDLGANTGVFTRIASKKGVDCVAFDVDPLAVEHNYLTMKGNKEKNCLPLVIDLTNPSPSIGWNNEERMSIKERGLPDTIMALALIHHLAISNNLPMDKIACFFHEICSNLIIEFVLECDSQVKKLLNSRGDRFSSYNKDAFEKSFLAYFNILRTENIIDSDRCLYLMTRK